MANTRRSGIRARKAAEFGLAVPYVVGHRLSRLAGAGLLPSARDRREFQLMGVEKIAAFSESWFAMSMAIWQANLALGSSMLAVTATPWLGGPAAQAGFWARHWQSTMAAVLDKGFEPIHRTATANARRLKRPRRSRNLGTRSGARAR